MLYISRHGIRLDKIQKEQKGNPNPPLHRSGIAPLIESAKMIENIDYIFCSPFVRCVQTAHFLNVSDAPIFIEYGMSETLKERWYKGNPLNGLSNSYDYSKHYYNVDTNYVSYMKQSFPESRRDSRSRTNQFMNWLKASEYWDKDILLVGHGFSVKDCLNNLGFNPPFQGWNGSFPNMGHLFKIEKTMINNFKK